MAVKHRRLLLGVAAAHLFLVALGASTVSLGGLGPPGRALDEYGQITGASSGYGFFSPGVSFQLGARFDVVDGAGNVSPAALATGSSHEADIRVGNIVDQFGSLEDDEELSDEEADQVRRALAASLAGKMFSRYPGASAVVVRLETFEPLSMEAFRAGERPAWSPLYTAKFVHSSRPGAEPSEAESTNESDDD